MSIPRGYVPNHKFWDRMGRVTPNVEWSESHRPHFESFAAPWLPTQRYEVEIEAYYTVSSGKVVGLDGQGFLVPAGLRKAWNIASGSNALVYTQTDVDNYVIDLTTGELLTDTATYTEAQLTAALKERGLIRPDQRAMDFISKPIGIASYNYFKASASDNSYNPRTLFQHNFRPQANCAVTCDYVATYPVLPAIAADETMDGALANLEDSIDWSSTRTGGWFGSTALNGLTAYSSKIDAGDDIVAYVFTYFPMAHITADSPITVDNAGLVNQVDSVDLVTAAGDYYIDYNLGMLFLYSAGGTAIPSPFTAASVVTYYHYQAEGTATNTVSTYACATGNLEYGDFLTYDSNSNLIKAELDIANAEGYNSSFALYSADPDYSGAADAEISLQLEQAVSNYTTGIVGQILGTVEFPKDYLDRVKTAYQGQTAAINQAPGSATGGRTDQLTYTNSAEKMIIVNLIFR